jgi:hypothetical protein
MTLTVTLCAEDALAAGLSSQLLDRVVSERASMWLRDLWNSPVRDELRRVVDLEGGPGWSDRPHIDRLQHAGPPRRGIRAHPRDLRTNRPLIGNAARAYTCVRLAAIASTEVPRVLVLAFDTDGYGMDQRCEVGVASAQEGRTFDFGVVVAEAHPEFDVWVIAGFEPGPTHESRAHREVCAQLAMDPTAKPHELTSNVAGDPRDAKVLCARLLHLDGQAHPEHPRVRQCILDTALERLIARGAQAGLADFVDAVTRTVLPLLGDVRPLAEASRPRGE